VGSRRHGALRDFAARPAAVAALACVVLLTACSGPIGGVLGRVRSAAPAAANGSIDAFVPEAVRFVESHRGLKYKHPVKVQHMSDQAFSARVIDLQHRDRADFDRQAKVLRGLGLIKPGVDPEKAEEELLGTGVVGFYDPRTKELEVRGDKATLSVKHRLVHELTHALQDQWFSLSVQSSGNDDADAAYLALVEGDAVRIETEYIGSLSAKDRQDLRTQESGGGSLPSDVPTVLVQLLEFPYDVGPTFTRAVVQARGQRGLDDAFRHRPTASSQVLHPERFLNSDNPVPLPDPTADGPAFDHGSIGEVGFIILLDDAVRSGALNLSQVRGATDGWAGDRYTAWSHGDGYCVRDRVALKTGAESAAMATALQTFVSSHPGSSVSESPPPAAGQSPPAQPPLLLLTSCA
jgi:hypothetical protein